MLELLRHDDDLEMEKENLLLRVEHQKHQDHHQRRRGRYELDITGWDDDEEDKEDGVHEVLISEEQSTQRDSSDVVKETTNIENLFIDSYMKSIRPARDTIYGQWGEYSWDNKYLNIEPHVNDDEVKSPSTCTLCFYSPHIPATYNN